MKIEKRIHNKELEIIVEGRLDASTSPELDKVLSNISGIDSLIINLKGLEYMSSSGLRVLLACHKRMPDDKKMIIINANEDIKDIFDVTGFSSIFNIA